MKICSDDTKRIFDVKPFCDCDDETNATFHETVLERINVMLGTLRDTIDQRRDTDSYLVYALLVLNFASEFSFMTLSFPIVVFGYALLSPGLKSQLFWRLLLCWRGDRLDGVGNWCF